MCRLGRALRSGDEDEGRGEEGGWGGAKTGTSFFAIKSKSSIHFFITGIISR
jgi:hypothetical protein